MADKPMRLFHPILTGAHFSDRLIACIGAIVGIGLTIALSQYVAPHSAVFPLIAAPLGASAVLIFAVPASPLAQPWPVLGGNVISVLVGVTLYHLVPDPLWAAALAVGCAILLMSLLQCLHPPGGAAALTAVIGGPPIHDLGYSFAFMPVGINCLALLSVALIFHRFSRHSYPHKAAPIVPTGLHLADIDAALEDMHESFDISREDLDALLTRAEHHAAQRGAKLR